MSEFTFTREELTELLTSAAAVGFERGTATDGGWPIQTRGDLTDVLRRYPTMRKLMTEPSA